MAAAGWSAAQRWGQELTSALVLLVLARLLQPDMFGLVAMAMVFVALGRVLIDQGFGEAIVQRENLEAAHLDTAFWTCLGIGALLTLIGVAGAEVFARVFGEPGLAVVIRWLSLEFVVVALSSTQVAILRRDLEFRPLAVRSLVGTVIGGLVGIVMALNGFGVWSLVAKTLSGGAIGTIVLWSATDWRPSLRFSVSHFRDLFSFGANILAINLLNFVNRRTGDLLIGIFLGPTALGYYDVAYRLFRVATSLVGHVISTVAYPAYARMQGDLERLRSGFLHAVHLTAVVSMPALVGLAVVAPDLIPVLYGEQWVPSVPVLQVLMGIGILHSVFLHNGAVLKATNHPHWALYLNVVHAALNVIALLIAVRWGIVAVAAAFVIRGYVMAPINLRVVQAALPFRLAKYLRALYGPLAASLAMALIIALLQPFLAELDPSGRVLISISTGAALYGLYVLLWERNELRFVVQTARGGLG
jgi:PST family polysaccharide transporter